VVGFTVDNPINIYPAAFDTTSPLQVRSYDSVDGVSFNLLDAASGVGGNLGIRATVTVGNLTNPTLSIIKTHVGNFTQGQQNATYTVTVSNAANASPTNGTVTVTETLPSGFGPVSMSGTGWTCNSLVCNRFDALAGGSIYPPITVTVNVAGDASSPQVNQVSVSGGGSSTANAFDSTVVTLTRADYQ